jgi:hypothetical protein
MTGLFGSMLAALFGSTLAALFGSILAATTILTTPAMAAVQNERIRGTIKASDQHSVTVQTPQGKEVKVSLNDATKYVTVAKSNLSKVATGSFIGTATKGAGASLVALEVVIFPPSLRGMGEGHYAWDELPDTTMAGGARVSSSMTNGTVETTSPGGPKPKVNSKMTNGAVQSATEQGGAKRITVTYNGGQQTILVPPTAPIVAFLPAERPAVTTGAHVFIKASDDGGKATADFVAIGQDGLTPPM